MKNLHEDLSRGHQAQQASERSFGCVFAVVFALIALYPLVEGNEIHGWAAVLALVFAFFSFFYPPALKPLNSGWLMIGKGLHRIISPLMMAVMFFLVITPMGLVMRVLGKDPLHRRFEPEVQTYWISRDPPGPDPKSMRNQF